MARYRLIPRQYKCDSDHVFDATLRYEYSQKTTEFQMRVKTPDLDRGTWQDPWYKFPVCPECEQIVVTPALVDGKAPVLQNVQVPESEAAAVAIHPATGEVSYCFDRPDKPLPQVWKDLGFQKVQFHHYNELQRFCRQRGLVNDMEGDWKHEEGFFEEQQAIEERRYAEQREMYMAERERMMSAYPELRKRSR